MVDLPVQGFTVRRDISVLSPGVGVAANASTIHISWNDIYGTAANGAIGTLDAEFSFWGTQEMLVIDGRTIGDIGFGPYLAESGDDAYADLLVLCNADWRATRTPVW